MSDKNYELELYKLIVTPDEKNLNFSYVSEFRWVNDKEFLVWVSFVWFKEFMDKLTEIFGYGMFDDGNFNANIQSDTVCIDLNDVLDGYVDIEEVFSKETYIRYKGRNTVNFAAFGFQGNCHKGRSICYEGKGEE